MTRRRRDPRTPVLRPGGPKAPPPLPYAVPLLAALGLVILVLSAVPAVRSQQRLMRESERLQDETRAIEAHIDGLRRELRDGSAQRYQQIKATRALFHRGTRYIEERDQRLETRAAARDRAQER